MISWRKTQQDSPVHEIRIMKAISKESSKGMGLSHWKGRTDINREAEIIVQAGLGKCRSCVLDSQSLRCPSPSEVGVSSKQLDTGTSISGERCGPVMPVW